jgi:hypothetical protein
LKVTNNSVVFIVEDLVKTNKPEKIVGQEIKVQPYLADRHLCLRRIVNCYKKRTRLIRGTEKQIFISFCKLHGHMSTDIIVR